MHPIAPAALRSKRACGSDSLGSRLQELVVHDVGDPASLLELPEAEKITRSDSARQDDPPIAQATESVATRHESLDPDAFVARYPGWNRTALMPVRELGPT